MDVSLVLASAHLSSSIVLSEVSSACQVPAAVGGVGFGLHMIGTYHTAVHTCIIAPVHHAGTTFPSAPQDYFQHCARSLRHLHSGRLLCSALHPGRLLYDTCTVHTCATRGFHPGVLFRVGTSQGVRVLAPVLEHDEKAFQAKNNILQSNQPNP